MKTHFSLLKIVSFAVCFVLLCGASLKGEENKGEEKKSYTDRISLNDHCITVDGKDLFIFSGAFHYFRCPKELWRDRFQTIKDAGFNAVDTYVAWNWHEREKPVDLKDFSKVDLTDIKDWLRMAHEEFGLYTIVRPGPYICAEWAGGGFPRWLLTFKPEKPKHKVWIRSDDPVFLDWSKHWFDAVCPALEAEQITHKPIGKAGTILFQIENEYDFWNSVKEEAKINHLKFLYKTARDNGIVVPIFTCWTREVRNQKDPLLKGVFDSSNFYHRLDLKNTARSMGELKKNQPHVPGMIAELQGGWFSTVGGKLSEDQPDMDAGQIKGITFVSMMHSATILNYYMLFGGTNLGAWAARGVTTTYDYYAPIRENGGVDEKYAAVREISKLLQQYGSIFLRSDLVPSNVAGADKNLIVCMRRGQQGESYIFCINISNKEKIKGTVVLRPESGDPLNIIYDLDPLAYQICYLAAHNTHSSKGQWLLERPAMSPVSYSTSPGEDGAYGSAGEHGKKEVYSSRAHRGRRADIIVYDSPPCTPSVRIAKAWKKVEPEVSPSQWKAIKEDTSLPELGIYDTRYVLYRSLLDLTPEQVKKYKYLALKLFTDDHAVVRVNSQVIPQSEFREGLLFFDLAQNLHPGQNEIIVLHDDLGHSNWGESIEDLAGLSKGMLTEQLASMPLDDWRVKLVSSQAEGRQLAITQPDDSTWEHFMLDPQTLKELDKTSQPGAEGPRWPAARILFGKRATAVFQTTVNVTEAMLQSKCTKLVLDRIDDVGIIVVNGREVGKWEDYQKPFAKDVAPKLKVGPNKIAVVLTNKEGDGGLTRAARLTTIKLEGLDLNWELAPELAGIKAGWQTANLPTDNWTPIALDACSPLSNKGAEAPSGKAEALATWYRLEFQLPDKKPNVWVPWRAVLEASGNGYLYLNGQALGRYWEIGPQREYFLPECWLNVGPGKTNVLVLCLRPTEKGTQLRGAEIAPYLEYAEERN